MTASPVIGAPGADAVSDAWAVERDARRGLVFVRRSAELSIEPQDWRDRLAATLRRIPGVAAVGAKQLDAEGNVFAMGAFIVHPKGFHFHGKGVPGTAYRFPEEVDAVPGGVLAVDADAFDAAEGEALLDGPLGAVALCLALRERGGRCLSDPSVVATDPFELDPTPEQEQAFAERFGFDWLAADMEAVVERQGGNGLLWNARFHGVAMPFEKYDSRPAMHWTSYAQAEPYRKRADHLAGLVAKLCPDGAPALDLGCGDGLFTHLAAKQGVAVTGLDPEAAAIDQARAQCDKQQYPGQRPQFVVGRGDQTDFDDGSFELIYMLDVIEHLPNPVSVIREAARLLRPTGKLLITTPAWQLGASSDATYHVTEYTAEELIRQTTAATRHGPKLQPAHLGKIGGVYRDLVLVLQRAG